VIRVDFKTFDNGLGIAQLEGFDLEYLVNKQQLEISAVLAKLKHQHNLQFIFLTAADINQGYNIFVVIDEESKLLLAKSMNLKFNDEGIAKNDKLLLRKQILPLLNK
jgi:inorganic pyrophosphatase/exopolyphosphatase